MDFSQLPADVWTSRLAASLLDRAPHIEERDGQAVWVCDASTRAGGYRKIVPLRSSRTFSIVLRRRPAPHSEKPSAYPKAS